MRVIAGSARGRKLFAPEGNRVRPTSDRVKEALFSSLVSRFGSLDGLTLLDLFAGSGALGIEALSRGANRVVFVDSHRDSITLLKKNLQMTGFTDRAEIVQMDAVKYLQQALLHSCAFDIILADPPYADKSSVEIVLLIAENRLLNGGGIAVVETARNADIIIDLPFSTCDRRLYGDTALWYFEMENGMLQNSVKQESHQ